MRSPVSCVRVLTSAVLLATALVAPAHPGVLNLRWNACWGDGGTQNRVFACNTNTGVERLVASFISPRDVPQMNAAEFVVDIATQGTTIAPWWFLGGPTSCRPTSLALEGVAPVGAVACEEWDLGNANGLLVAMDVSPSYPTGRIEGSLFLPADVIMSVLAGREYHAFTLVINHQRTVGTGACAGCDLGACLAFKYMALVSPVPYESVDLFLPLRFGSADDGLVTWQGGTGVAIPGPIGLRCPAATPTRMSTWGAVKSLYR